MSSDTYENILATARRLFVQQGYTATSMRQVAEAAQIGKATIYHHFPGKLDIVKALLEKYLSRMDETLRLVRAEVDPRSRIRVAVRESIAFLFESADIIQVVRREIPDGRNMMQGGYTDFFHEFMTLLAEAVRRGAEVGEFRSIDPVKAARVLMTMIQGTFAMAYLVNERSKTPEEAAASLLDVYFQGLDSR